MLGIFTLQQLKLPDLARLQAAILVAPAIIRLLGYVQLAAEIHNVRPESKQRRPL